jgi:hypothetical protein
VSFAEHSRPSRFLAVEFPLLTKPSKSIEYIEYGSTRLKRFCGKPDKLILGGSAMFLKKKVQFTIGLILWLSVSVSFILEDFICER